MNIQIQQGLLGTGVSQKANSQKEGQGEQLTLSTPRSHYSNRTNPKEKNGKTPPIAQDISGIPPALRRSKFQSSSTISWM